MAGSARGQRVSLGRSARHWSGRHGSQDRPAPRCPPAAPRRTLRSCCRGGSACFYPGSVDWPPWASSARAAPAGRGKRPAVSWFGGGEVLHHLFATAVTSLREGHRRCVLDRLAQRGYRNTLVLASTDAEGNISYKSPLSADARCNELGMLALRAHEATHPILTAKFAQTAADMDRVVTLHQRFRTFEGYAWTAAGNVIYDAYIELLIWSGLADDEAISWDKSPGAYWAIGEYESYKASNNILAALINELSKCPKE
jgi:hypothetical protein